MEATKGFSSSPPLLARGWGAPCNGGYYGGAGKDEKKESDMTLVDDIGGGVRDSLFETRLSDKG